MNDQATHKPSALSRIFNLSWLTPTMRRKREEATGIVLKYRKRSEQKPKYKYPYQWIVWVPVVVLGAAAFILWLPTIISWAK